MQREGVHELVRNAEKPGEAMPSLGLSIHLFSFSSFGSWMFGGRRRGKVKAILSCYYDACSMETDLPLIQYGLSDLFECNTRFSNGVSSGLLV